MAVRGVTISADNTLICSYYVTHVHDIFCGSAMLFCKVAHNTEGTPDAATLTQDIIAGSPGIIVAAARPGGNIQVRGAEWRADLCANALP